MLSLAEELILLALRDEKGTIHFSASTALPYAAAGAVLLELLFEEKITMQGNLIIPATTKLPKDPILSETLKLIRESTKQRNTKHWIHTIQSKVKMLEKRIITNLVDKNILRHDEKKVLWIFNLNRYPTLNAVPELEIRNRIRGIVLHKNEASERDIALISLMKACELVNEVFAKDERKVAKARIKEIAKQSIVGKAVSKIVSDITAAITAVIVASAAASAATS